VVKEVTAAAAGVTYEDEHTSPSDDVVYDRTAEVTASGAPSSNHRGGICGRERSNARDLPPREAG
jgi:hypothetical protein